MSDTLTIALDAMGGDRGPDMVIPGADLILQKNPELRLLLFGAESRVAPLLKAHPLVRDRSEFIACSVSISMDDKPSQALRRGRRVSSMWQAIESVKQGRAAVAVSAGNTGALIAMSKIILDTMTGISRPAIAARWPTLKGESIVLDVGATIGADAEQLFDFAIMGEAMARCLFNLERPTVGLLNVGVEEIKGIEQVKEAGQLLRNSGLPMEYIGFVEGDDISKGTADVVVTEGFTGNIALKTAEGTAKQIGAYLKGEMNRSVISRIGYLLARPAFRALRDKLDPRAMNGGVLLGLNGIVVKSHGGTDALGFAAALKVAVDMAENHLIGKIGADLAAKQALMDRLRGAEPEAGIAS
jgi:glycerol-3-phosphate acyltransferase PlsX